MDTRHLTFLALALSLSAHGATLAPDALVCESPSNLEFVARTVELKGRPASVVLQRASASVEGYRLQGQIARTVSMPRQASAEQASAGAEPYAAVVAGCAIAQPGTAEVLERRPISGIAQIRTNFRGQPAELWTFSAGLSE